VCEIADFNSVL